MKKLILSLALLLTVSMSAFAQIFRYKDIDYKILSEIDNTVGVFSGISFNGSELIIPEKVIDEIATKEYTVTGICNQAFANNANIISVSIPASMKTIGNNAFQNCGNLTSLTFEGESQLKQISDQAFYNTVLTTIDIPASVTSIGTFAFGENTALQQVYMHLDNPSGYSSDAFRDSPDAVIYVPIESYETYKSNFAKNKVEVELTEWKTYAENKIEEGLNALNTLSDEDRNDVNKYLSDITTAVTFDAAYVPFKNAMPIINAQSNLEKKLTDAIGIFATRKNGPTIEIRANDGTTIKLYNIEKVNFGKEETEE